MMGDDSFDAPSDYQSSSGGSETSIWMWVGIGCGAILLILAGTLIFGGYKSYSCCKQAIERQKAARQAAARFARDLRDGDYQSARGRTTEAFRSRTSRETLQRRVEQYRDRIDGSVPELVGFRRHLDEKGGGGGAWELDVGFMPHAGETFVFMRLQLHKQGQGENLEFRVDEMRLEERRRDVATEPPARQVRRFNKLVDEGEFDVARGRFTDSFEPGGSNERFRAYLDKHESVFGSGAPEFRSIQYERGPNATVLAGHRTSSGETVHVRYVMEKSGATWMIATIEVGVEPPRPEPAVPATPDADTADTTEDGSDVSGD